MTRSAVPSGANRHRLMAVRIPSCPGETGRDIRQLTIVSQTEGRHGLRSGDQGRAGDRRHRHARVHGRRRGRGRAHRAHRAGERGGAARDRRGRPGRRARVHRRAHPLRRPARLGPDRLAVVVARRDHGARRQLRLHAGAGAAAGRRLAGRHAEPGGGHVARRPARGSALPRRRLRRLLGALRRARRGQRRRLRGAQRGAALRHGRRRVGAPGDRRRDRGHAGPGAPRHARGGDRLLVLAARHPRRRGRSRGAVQPRLAATS